MQDEYVRDWMTKWIITTGPDTSLPEAEKLMRAHRIRRLPVVDETGELEGIVTYGDIRDARPSSAASLSIWELCELLSRLTVAAIMTRDVVTVRPDTTIGEAALLMMTHKIGGLPVVDEAGCLAGIITESDIFRLVVRQWHPTFSRTQERMPATLES